MAGQKSDLPGHDSQARPSAASRRIGEGLRRDPAEIQIDLASRVVKQQEASLWPIF
jgi:hypothetical protein